MQLPPVLAIGPQRELFLDYSLHITYLKCRNDPPPRHHKRLRSLWRTHSGLFWVSVKFESEVGRISPVVLVDVPTEILRFIPVIYHLPNVVKLCKWPW